MIRFIKSFPFTPIDIESIEDIDLQIEIIDMRIISIYKDMAQRLTETAMIDNYLFNKVWQSKHSYLW